MATPTSAELRESQRPLKERYREDPSSARTPSRAVARVSTDGISATVPTWAGEQVAGLHPATGGDGSQACSADLLLEAVAACAGVTLRSVAIAMGIELRSAEVVVDGTWDARGTLAVDRETPVGLTDVTVTFRLDTDADEAATTKLVQLAERYCVVAQTLMAPPPVTVRHERLDGAASDAGSSDSGS